MKYSTAPTTAVTSSVAGKDIQTPVMSQRFAKRKAIGIIRISPAGER